MSSETSLCFIKDGGTNLSFVTVISGWSFVVVITTVLVLSTALSCGFAMRGDVDGAAAWDDALLEYWNDNKIHYNCSVTMTTFGQ